MRIRNFAIALFLLNSTFSKSAFGQAPTLGLAAEFSLFTPTGAFTNLGPTVTTNSIGTNAGLFSGFPPGTSLGSIHIIDSLTSQASVDVSSAYAFLAAKTCGTVIGTTLGNNQVLTPDVYCIGGATTLNGDLILDALGDPNTLFFIKIDGTLSTSTFARVVLMDSAKSENVYWQINGAFSLGDSALMLGTLLVNGAIDLLDGSSLFGRGLSINGAISLHSNTVGINFFNPLPVELVNFRVKALYNKQGVDLFWQTCSEQNSANFEILKSTTGKNYEKIGVVIAAGKSFTLKNYKFIDPSALSGINFYKLKLVDLNGTYEYSNAISITINDNQGQPVFYPNPFNNTLNYKLPDFSSDNLTEFIVYNSDGKVVLEQNMLSPNGNLSTKELNAGIYYYTIIVNKEVNYRGKLIHN